MFKKALIPLDGSKPSEAILPYVSYLAKSLSIPIVAMTAIDPHILGYTNLRYEVGGSDPSPAAGKRAVPVNPELKATKYLQEIANRMSREGLQAEFEVVVGNPAEQIVRAAERQRCNLIALSSYSESPPRQGILGSVTMKVLYHSPIPTLIFKPIKAAQPVVQEIAAPKLIVPLDGSSFGETALGYAAELARKLSLEIVLIQAVQEPLGYMADPGFGTPMVPLQEVATAEAAEHLKRLTEEFRTEGVAAHSELFKGNPAQKIVEFSRRSPQSLIVMTSHGHSALARWLIGSVTETVVRTADNPVLVIPRQYGRRYAIEVTEMLQRVPIFSKLTEEDLERIAQTARVLSYQPGDLIIREGDRAGGFFIMTSGKVEVIKGADTSSASVLDAMGPGEFFGEMAMLDDQPRSATVRVVEPTECVTIRRSDFLAELERHPEIAVRMLPELVRRLREAREKPTQ